MFSRLNSSTVSTKLNQKKIYCTKNILLHFTFYLYLFISSFSSSFIVVTQFFYISIYTVNTWSTARYSQWSYTIIQNLYCSTFPILYWILSPYYQCCTQSTILLINMTYYYLSTCFYTIHHSMENAIESMQQS